MVPGLSGKCAGRVLCLPRAADGSVRRSLPQGALGKKICVLLVSHNGAAADAEKAVNAVRAALPEPIIDFAGPIPYLALQGMFDGLYPKGLHWYWKGDFVKTLPDAAIDVHIQQAAKVPSTHFS